MTPPDRKNQIEGSIPPVGDTHSLLQTIIERYPRRSQSVGMLRTLLAETGSISSYERLNTLRQLKQFMDGKCTGLYSWTDHAGVVHFSSKPEHSRYSPTWNMEYTVDQALFLLIHPQQKEGSWASIAHHRFTWYNGEWGPQLAVPLYPEFSLNPFAQTRYKLAVNFRMASIPEEMQTIEKLRDVEVSGLTHIPTITIDGKSLIIADPNNSNGTYLEAEAYIPVTFNIEARDARGEGLGYHDDGAFDHGWQIYGLDGISIRPPHIPY